MSTPNNQEQNAAKLAQAIRACLEDMQTPAYRERLRYVAADAFARYQSFMAAGFTETQALAIVIAKL